MDSLERALYFSILDLNSSSFLIDSMIYLRVISLFIAVGFIYKNCLTLSMIKSSVSGFQLISKDFIFIKIDVGLIFVTDCLVLEVLSTNWLAKNRCWYFGFL